MRIVPEHPDHALYQSAIPRELFERSWRLPQLPLAIHQDGRIHPTARDQLDGSGPGVSGTAERTDDG
jgi:hypothetical protein